MKISDYNHFIRHFYCKFSVYLDFICLGMMFRKKAEDFF